VLILVIEKKGNTFWRNKYPASNDLSSCGGPNGTRIAKNVKSDTNDGGAGNTFEYHLGVVENNLTNPDFAGFEIKTKKTFTHSAISLFTKKPSSKEYGDNYMREQFGIPDKRYSKIKCFRTSIYANRYSEVYGKYKIKLGVNRKQRKLYFEVYDLNEKLIDNNVFWTFDSIQKGSKKLNNLIIINANKKKIDGKDHFNYTDAKVLIDNTTLLPPALCYGAKSCRFSSSFF